jgi:hypothetical protein
MPRQALKAQLVQLYVGNSSTATNGARSGLHSGVAAQQLRVGEASMAASSAAAQQRRLASLQQRQQPPQDEPPIGAAVSFGAVTVHSAALLAEICGEPEPEPEPEPLPGPRHGAGGSVSVNVDTLVCALHLVLGLALSVALARLLARGRPPGCRAHAR